MNTQHYDTHGRIILMSDEESKSDLDQNAETPRLNGNAPPSWLASQDVTPAETPKAKRARRTKAQMLADAAARPNADRTITAPSLLVTQAIETSRANADEIASFAPRRGNGASRLPIIAVAMSILALAVSIINAAH